MFDGFPGLALPLFRVEKKTTRTLAPDDTVYEALLMVAPPPPLYWMGEGASCIAIAALAEGARNRPEIIVRFASTDANRRTSFGRFGARWLGRVWVDLNIIEFGLWQSPGMFRQGKVYRSLRRIVVKSVGSQSPILG